MSDEHLPLAARWRKAFEDATQRLEGLMEGLNDEQANWRPAPDRWSVAECVAHLNITAEAYQPRMERAIARGRARGRTGAPPYGRGTLAGRLLLALLDPARPNPRRLRAPKTFQPAPGRHEPGEVAASFRSANRRLLTLVTESEGLALGRIRLSTPVSRLLRITLAQAFEVLAVHEHRHLAQAEGVRADPAFPA